MGYRMVLGHQFRVGRGMLRTLASSQAPITHSSFVRRFVTLGGDAHQKGVRPGGIGFCFPVGAFGEYGFFFLCNYEPCTGLWDTGMPR